MLPWKSQISCARCCQSRAQNRASDRPPSIFDASRCENGTRSGVTVFKTGPGFICTQQVWHLSVRASHDAGGDPGCQSCSWYLQGKEEVSLFLFVDQDDLFSCPSWRGRQEQAAQSVLLDEVYSSFKGQKGQVVTHLPALTHIREAVQVFTIAERERGSPGADDARGDATIALTSELVM